jgi:hypothetical protein
MQSSDESKYGPGAPSEGFCPRCHENDEELVFAIDENGPFDFSGQYCRRCAYVTHLRVTDEVTYRSWVAARS